MFSETPGVKKRKKKIFYFTLTLYTITSLLQLTAEGLHKTRTEQILQE